MEAFEVSVIIPVYNAERYVERAVKSALNQIYVNEVIAIDDGYPDKSRRILEELASEDSNLRILEHEGRSNRGAGASRNLGIAKASCPFIAFLDADDYYLPDRFEKTKLAFHQDPAASAVYEPVGTEFDDDKYKASFATLKGISEAEAEAYVSYPLELKRGTDFFLGLLSGSIGSPHTDGICIRREAFSTSGLFEPELKLHQDTELWIRIAYHGNFRNGLDLEPVAVRTVHEENRIAKRGIQSEWVLRKILYNRWAFHPEVPERVKKVIKKRYYQSKAARLLGSNGIVSKGLWRLMYYISEIAKLRVILIFSIMPGLIS